MKKRFYLSFFTSVLLLACSSKTEKWSLDLEACIKSADSTTTILNETIAADELKSLLVDSRILFQEVKAAVSDDTLDVEFGQQLDQFSTAYRNALTLESEYTHCKHATSELTDRLKQLKSDIENTNGDRAEYCAYVTREKGELTKIQNHCKDIRLRFDELKAAKADFEPVFQVYQKGV